MIYLVVAILIIIIIYFLLNRNSSYTIIKTKRSINKNVITNEELVNKMKDDINKITNDLKTGNNNIASPFFKGSQKIVTTHTDSDGKTTSDVVVREYYGLKNNRCPHCGASISESDITCEYCSSKLK